MSERNQIEAQYNTKIEDSNVAQNVAEPDIFGNEELITGAKAMSLLQLSRHNFTKCIEKGYITIHTINGKNRYDLGEINRFQQSEEIKQIIADVVDSRNTLNDLTGKEWIPETKSYFFQKGLGKDHPEAQIEKQHPAPYSFQDIEKLVLFFTKRGMSVLDPFGGVGSTAKACELTGRICTSIELSPKYHNLSLQRLETEVGTGTSQKHNFINGDCCEELRMLNKDSMDFVVTSPPYWGILQKIDQKVKKNRVDQNLDTKYSDDERDLGNVADYQEFLDVLCTKVFMQCGRVLKAGKYIAIVVSDFRDKGEFISFHSDIIQHINKKPLEGGGHLVLQGIKALIQNHKSLHPYGYPFSYVENIHHQYIIIFKKNEK